MQTKLAIYPCINAMCVSVYCFTDRLANPQPLKPPHQKIKEFFVQCRARFCTFSQKYKWLLFELETIVLMLDSPSFYQHTKQWPLQKVAPSLWAKSLKPFPVQRGNWAWPGFHGPSVNPEDNQITNSFLLSEVWQNAWFSSYLILSQSQSFCSILDFIFVGSYLNTHLFLGFFDSFEMAHVTRNFCRIQSTSYVIFISLMIFKLIHHSHCFEMPYCMPILLYLLPIWSLF